MQISDAPSKLVLPWANAGEKTNPIPVASQQGITPGAASLADGFPPLCDTPLASGGIPPSMQDMNGGLYQMSAVDRWACAGGGFPYDATFSAAVGGYPKGARVLKASGGGYWISTADNNVTDPDTGGAGWASDGSGAITALTGDVNASGPGSAVATVNWPVPGTIGSTTPNTGRFITPASSDNSTNAATTAWSVLGFEILLASNGYIKLPTWLGGLTIQWGTGTAYPCNGSDIMSETISFPRSDGFPTACLICGLFTRLADTTSAGDVTWQVVGPPGKTSFLAQLQKMSSNQDSTLAYPDFIAIGY